MQPKVESMSVEQYANYADRDLNYLEGIADTLEGRLGDRLRGRVHAMKLNLKGLKLMLDEINAAKVVQ